MAAFAYKAVNARGRNLNGVLEGDNARQVRQQLREKGLIPLEVEQVAERSQESKKGFAASLFKPRISASDLALLTRQLATLVESSLPVEEALLAVAEQSEKPRQKNMMMAVRSKVVEGHGLADALAEFPSVFDDLFRAMVAIPSIRLPSRVQVAVFGEEAFGQARGIGFGGLVTHQQALQVTRQQIYFQIHFPPGAVVDHDGFGQGVRNNGEFELRAIDRIDRQAGAIDGDRALERDVLGQFAWRADTELHGAGILFTRNHLTHAIDVTADQVPAEATGRRQGLLQIHPATGLEINEGGARERLTADIGPEAVARQLNGGQTDAIDRNTVAELDVAQIQFAGLDQHSNVAALRRHGTNGPDGFDYSCEHAASRGRLLKRCI